MTPRNETVVLVHGLGGSRLDMWPMARRLRRIGFNTCNWSYRSFRNRIEDHAQRLAQFLHELDADGSGGRFHLVTHSMGGIIARAMFAEHRFQALGRVILLAPPNQGSHVARRLVPWVGWLTPSLKQLSDDENSFVKRLPNSLAESGIEFAIVEAAKDRVIKPGGVLLDGYRDYSSVDGHHGVLTWYRSTNQLVEDFLLHGNFSAATATEVKLPIVEEQTRQSASVL